MSTEDKKNSDLNEKNSYKEVLYFLKEFPIGLLWTLILGLGGVVYYSYYRAIGFLPTFDFNSGLSLIAAFAFNFLFLVSIMGACFCAPLFFVINILSKNPYNKRRQSIYFSVLLSWVFAFWSFLMSIIYGFAQSKYYMHFILIGLILFFVGVFCLLKNRSAKRKLDGQCSGFWRRVRRRFSKRKINYYFSLAAFVFAPVFAQLVFFVFILIVLGFSPVAHKDVESFEVTQALFYTVLAAVFLSLFSIFLATKGGSYIKYAVMISFISPIMITVFGQTASLFPTLTAFSTKSGGFLAEKIILDKDGCEAMNAVNPGAMNCKDNRKYSYCGVFVRSRVGEQQYFTINKQSFLKGKENVLLQDVIVPAVNVKMIVPATSDNAVIQDDDVKRKLFEYQIRNYPCDEGGYENKRVASLVIFKEKNDKKIEKYFLQETLKFHSALLKDGWIISEVQIYPAGLVDEESTYDGELYSYKEAGRIRDTLERLNRNFKNVKLDWTVAGYDFCEKNITSDDCKKYTKKLIVDFHVSK